MHIQRMIEESMMGARGEEGKIRDGDGGNCGGSTKTMRSMIISLDPCENNNKRNDECDKRSINDRLIYATIDSLALKRARLPLQLLPIDDEIISSEPPLIDNNEERNHREINDKFATAATSRKNNAQRRPSFKVRPGPTVTAGQWKCRSRSSTRIQAVTSAVKLENVISKEALDDPVNNVNIIRFNNNQDCKILETSCCCPSDDDRNITETKRLIRDENSTVNQSVGSLHTTDRAKQNAPGEETDTREFQLEDGLEKNKVAETSETGSSRLHMKKKKKKKKKKKESDISLNENKVLKISSETTSSSSSGNDICPKRITRRSKPQFTFAKNVLHYVPISVRAKRSKKSKIIIKSKNNIVKNREESLTNSRNNEATTTSLDDAGIKKNLSRKQLRSVSISSPTNFVHISSATSSKILPRNIEVSELRRNSLMHPGIDVICVKIERDWKKKLSSGENDRILNGAKVTCNLEKCHHQEQQQGVPEVVKISENEDNCSSNVGESRDVTTSYAPVYEAMSEFSIDSRCYSTLVAPNSPFVANNRPANTSFLWGDKTSGRADAYTRSYYDRNSSIAGTSELTRKTRIFNDNNDEIVNDTNNAKTDYFIDDNTGYDAYDDVGLSPRADNEEDDYDDVGLPFTVGIIKSTSVDTLFEEMSLDENGCQLYDDVVPGPFVPKKITSKDDKIYSNATIESFEKMYNNNSARANEQERDENDENPYLSIENDYSSVEEEEEEKENDEEEEGKDGEKLDDFEDEMYDDVQLPSHQERVNSLYAGSSSGSQLGSLNNGKESEWEDFEEAAPVLPLLKKNNVASRNTDSQSSPGKKKMAHRRSRKVRRQRSKSSRKNQPSSRSTSRTPVRAGTSTFSDTASDDSNYETLLSSFPSDEFSSCTDDDEDSIANSSIRNGASIVDSRVDSIVCQEAPSRPIPPPPRESSLTETFGKRMKMLRRTWSITKGSLGRMRRRTSTSNVDNDTSNLGESGNKYTNCEQQQQQQHPSNDGRKYFSFKKHFRKSVTGLSTFYLEMNDGNNVHVDERLSGNNNLSKEEIYSNSSSESNWYTNTEYWKSSRNDVDHYSMLDEEPLYQFYAAAAARVAIESDSEGYEEVEDPMPSPSAVDLAKPGHRTLWCQTPQIINSALLQRLTPDEKKCQEAKFEILTSEASYLNSLRVLVDEFLNNHDLMHEVLSPSEREKLFGGVPSVLMASERLLAELETVWREDTMLSGLPELLLNYAQRSSSVYVAYCSNQVSIDTTLKELRSRKGSKFVDTITRIESHPACHSLSLHSFLMLPMQRVTRLPLLADAVLSKLSTENKDERKRWECSLSHLSQVVMECNEGARAAGRLAEMEALERKLEYSSKVPPIVLRDRYLIRRGPVVQILAKSDADYKLTFGKKYHKSSLYLLLLTDYILIAKSKSSTNEETYTVTDTCKRSLVALEKVTEDSPFAGRNAMVLTLLENYSGRHVEYILTCDNATERERWLDAISPPKPSLVGESLYETWDCPQVMALYPYAAAQPDELTVQPGDVINVLRKMTDGWHLGEKLLGGEQGWFPGNYAKEVASEHVRARNLRQRHRLLALSTSVLQQRAKHASR